MFDQNANICENFGVQLILRLLPMAVFAAGIGIDWQACP